MMTTAEKLTALRRAMARRGLAAYLVPTDDFHASEYVGDYFKAREYLSGFTGSAGTLLILPSRALLWTDGRYFLQAESQLAGSGIELMRSGEPDVPTLERFLLAELEDGSLLGFDARTVNTALARRLGNKLRTKHIRFAGDEDLVDALCPTDRRSPPRRCGSWGSNTRAKRARTSSRACARRWRTRERTPSLSRHSTSLRGCWICAGTTWPARRCFSAFCC